MQKLHFSKQVEEQQTDLPVAKKLKKLLGDWHEPGFVWNAAFLIGVGADVGENHESHEDIIRRFSMTVCISVHPYIR